MNQLNSETLKNNTIIYRLWWTLLLALIACSAIYFYLISDSVFNVAARQKMEADTSELQAKVSSLEADYMARLSLINLVTAKSLGFVDSSQHTIYAVLNHPTVSFLAVKNEI